MTTEEIKQAIEESIVPNNKKAISAQSLKNVLMALAENSGGSSEGLYFFGIYDCLNRDMIPTGNEENDEMFTLIMDWNAMTYAKLEEIVNLFEYAEETAEIPPINITIISFSINAAFIPAVVTLMPNDSTGELLFVITPCNEYKNDILSEVFTSIDGLPRVGYTLYSDGSYTRFNPLCIFLPEENITLSEWVNEYNREVCKALIWQTVEPSKIQVIYVNSYSLRILEDYEQDVTNTTFWCLIDFITVYSRTIGRCATVRNFGDKNAEILFTDNSGIHRINIDSNYNPTTVTNLIEFPEA